MGSTREKSRQLDFISIAWRCPHCGRDDGVEISNLVPTYQNGELMFQGGRWMVKPGDSVEVYWDGADKDEVLCLECREVIELEVDY